MNPRTVLLAIALSIAGCLVGPPDNVLADVIVLANRTPVKVEFAIIPGDGATQLHAIEAHSVISLPLREKVTIAFDGQREPRRSSLEPNSIHYFQVNRERIELYRLAIDLNENHAREGPAGASAETLKPAPVTIPVKILTDEEEPGVRRVWEARIRRRVARASEIIERHCRVRFEVVAVETWDSDDELVDFSAAVEEFQREVSVKPAQLAIGFTAQHKESPASGQPTLTPRPLGSHLLLREWSPNYSSTERLELLVHELGHFLGAVHCPDPSSVMRAVVNDHRSQARGFHIGFDPVNTMVLSLMGEELRRDSVRQLHQVSDLTTERLVRLYSAMAQAYPQDATARNARALLRAGLQPANENHPLSLDPLVRATQKVVSEVARAAAAEKTARLAPGKEDVLTEILVRRAAEVASQFPAEVGPNAFLLGIGIAIDDSDVLQQIPRLAQIYQAVELPEQRRARLRTLGKPTVRGRRDLAQHFVVSCALAASLGPRAADAAGLAKEIRDANDTSGFSFSDFYVDVAGVTLAMQLTQSNITLQELAESFTVEDFVPQISDLRDGISWEELVKDRGFAIVDDLRRQIDDIRKSVLALPGYRRAGSVSEK